MKFIYNPKWKEELVGNYGDYYFSVELTMGILHVYFPEESTWANNAPDWAVGKWSEARDVAKEWADSQNIPFTIDKAAWVDFHNKN